MAMGKGEGRMMEAPEKYLYPGIPHYYGDVSRRAFLLAATLMILGAPLYSDDLPSQFPFEIVSALIIVAFAALTSPHRRRYAVFDTLASAAGAAVFGTWALAEYGSANTLQLMLRIFLALIFVFAFYFSLKTLRAFLMHQIGKPDSPAEFRRSMPALSEDELLAEGSAPRVDPLAREKERVERYDREERGD